MVQGILLALMQREKTGVGQSLSVSLYDSMLAMQMQEAAMWLARKRELNWGAFPLTGVFETTDGALVIVGAFKANPLQDICRALGLPDLSADPELRDLRQAGREQGRAAPPVPQQALDRHHGAIGWPSSRSRTCSARRCRPWARRSASEQTAANNMVVSLDANGSGRNEPLKLVASPITMDTAAFQLRHAPPSLGEHGTRDPGRAGLRAGPHRRAAHGQGAVA